MSTTDINRLAKEIITSNNYMILSSANNLGIPWICILAYAYDQKYNFYFVSMNNAKHVQQIGEHSDVAVAIFDSRQLIMKGVGLQIEGKCYRVDDKKAMGALEVIFSRKWPYGVFHKNSKQIFVKLLKKNIYSVFCFTPKRVWINDPNSDVDQRLEVNLK